MSALLMSALIIGAALRQSRRAARQRRITARNDAYIRDAAALDDAADAMMRRNRTMAEDMERGNKQ